MDPRPSAIVRRELAKLLAEMDKAKQPSNKTLYRAVLSALHPMIDRETDNDRANRNAMRGMAWLDA